MNNKYKKGAFIITLVLLVITLPLAVIGIIFKANGSGENPNKEFYYDNKLYFYDKSEKLIGTYECQFKNCGYAKQIDKDDEYSINHYKSDSKQIITNNPNYAFISDYKDEQGLIELRDIKQNKESSQYKSVKNYGIGIVNDYYIAEAISGTYGVIQLKNNKVENIIPFVYEYIALQNDVDLEQNKVSADTFIVSKDGKWMLIDKNQAEFTNASEHPIVAFDSSTYITKDENYNLYSYEGVPKLSGEYKYLNYVSKFIEVKDANNNYYILDKENMTLVSSLYQVTDESVIDTKINEDDKLEIIIDNESKEIIEIL